MLRTNLQCKTAVRGSLLVRTGSSSFLKLLTPPQKRSFRAAVNLLERRRTAFETMGSSVYSMDSADVVSQAWNGDEVACGLRMGVVAVDRQASMALLAQEAKDLGFKPSPPLPSLPLGWSQDEMFTHHNQSLKHPVELAVRGRRRNTAQSANSWEAAL